MDFMHVVNQFLSRGKPASGPVGPTPQEIVPLMEGQPGWNYMAGPYDPAAQQYQEIPMGTGRNGDVGIDGEPVGEIGALPPGLKKAKIPGQPGGNSLRARMLRNAGPGAQNFMGGGAMTFNVPTNISGGIRNAIGKLF